MQKLKSRVQKWFYPSSLAAVLGGIYFSTLAPDIYLEDSGELTAAAATLGIVHPPGYPLYLLLGKLFAFLPVGTLGFRLNLMSAVFAVAAAVVLYFAFLELAEILGGTRGAVKSLAWALSLLLGLSFDFWSQAIVAEVYALNTFLAALLILLFLKWWLNRRASTLLALAFLSGLGIANHQIFAFMVPVLWAIVYLRHKLNFQAAGRLLSLFAAGLSVYLYLPLRVFSGAELNFGRLSSWKDILSHILRLPYDDAGLARFADVQEFVLAFLQGLARNLSWVGLALALWGVLFFFQKKQTDLWVFLAGGFAVSALGPIFLRNTTFTAGAEFTYRVYYFQAYLFALMLAFSGVIFWGRRTQAALLIFFIFFAGWSVGRHYRALDLSPNPVAEYYRLKLESFDPQSIYLLIAEGYDYDSEIFALLYLQKALKLRPDVQIIDGSRLFYVLQECKEPVQAPAYCPKFDSSNPPLAEVRKQVLRFTTEKFGSSRKIYASFPVEAYTDNFVSISTPWAVAVVPAVAANAVASSAPPAPYPLNLRHSRENWDMAFQDFVASAHYHLAAYYLSLGEKDLAVESIAAAINHDNDLSSEDFRAWQAYRSRLFR